MRIINYLYLIVFIAGTSLQAVSLAELAGQNKELTSFTGTLAADLKKLLNRKNVQRAGIIAGALTLIALAIVGSKYLPSSLAANNDLIDAAVDGNLKRADSALLKGAQVNVRDSYGKTPLTWAVGSENKDLIRKLLDEGADPYQQDNFRNDALAYASEDIKDLILHHPKVQRRAPSTQ